MKRLLLALVLAAAMPLGAWAQPGAGTWVKWGDNSVTQSLTPGGAVLYQFTAAVHSEMLATHACPGMFVEFDPSIGDASAVSTVTLYQCTRPDGDADGTDDANACDTIDFDTNGDAIPDSNVLTGNTATRQRGFRELTAAFIFVEVNVTPNPDTGEVLIICPMEHP